MAFGSYAVNSIAATVAALESVVQVAPPASHVIDVLEASSGQRASVTSAMQPIQIITTTAAATVTAFTPIAVNAGGAASACVSGTGSTGINASGEGTTIVILVAEDFNVLSSWRYEPIPERRPRITPALFLALRYAATPATSLTVDSQVVFFELL